MSVCVTRRAASGVGCGAARALCPLGVRVVSARARAYVCVCPRTSRLARPDVRDVTARRRYIAALRRIVTRGEIGDRRSPRDAKAGALAARGQRNGAKRAWTKLARGGETHGGLLSRTATASGAARECDKEGGRARARARAGAPIRGAACLSADGRDLVRRRDVPAHRARDSPGVVPRARDTREDLGETATRDTGARASDATRLLDGARERNPPLVPLVKRLTTPRRATTGGGRTANDGHGRCARPLGGSAVYRETAAPHPAAAPRPCVSCTAIHREQPETAERDRERREPLQYQVHDPPALRPRVPRSRLAAARTRPWLRAPFTRERRVATPRGGLKSNFVSRKRLQFSKFHPISRPFFFNES
ncbi:PREDICTED: uncharacterized protein LOC105562085 [Vollenhovia emeryi]|uniref:uncharacterized protein LOC105562085 n=1 Tax=Vollenhovia emeryi TaxID=411798 RepID=UPI0005F46439|nr:PREDICTED: uncharacterized protein LOC105562085 [Vollenhovia emeryi]